MIMKKKNFNKKLSLNKMTISNLSNKEESSIYGGVNTTSPGDGASCQEACYPAPEVTLGVDLGCIISRAMTCCC